MKIRLFVLGAAATLLISCGNNYSTTKASLKTETDSVCYYIGYNIGQSVLTSPLKDKMNVEAFVAGMNSAIQKKELDMKPEQMNMFIQEYMQNAQNLINEQNKKEGEEFLAKKKTEAGIDSLEGGILYKVIKTGEGEKPGPKDVVKVHYTGKLIDGEVFDSSKDHSEADSLAKPIEFPLNRVIPGWSKAIQNMTVGSVWEIYIPSDLAYGTRGAGGKIGPNSTLIFEVELISFDPFVESEETPKK